jgi:hypothetical protein
MSKVVTPDPKSEKSFPKEKKPSFPPSKPSQSSQSLEEKLSLLYYGENSNFIKWREAMFLALEPYPQSSRIANFKR